MNCEKIQLINFNPFQSTNQTLCHATAAALGLHGTGAGEGCDQLYAPIAVYHQEPVAGALDAAAIEPGTAQQADEDQLGYGVGGI